MAKKKWDSTRGGRRSLIATEKCENCPPTGPRCSPCRSARRREVYALKVKRKRGPGTVACGIPHMRCDACRDGSQCKTCYNAQRIARRAVREAAAAAKSLQARCGAKHTIPRCAECPQYGRPCHTCFRRHRNALRAGRRAKSTPAPGLVKPRVRKEVSAEQMAARAEALAAKKASAETLREARAKTKRQQAEALAAGLLAEIARETRLSVCQVCQTRGRWEGSYCRRHAPVYAGGR